MKNEKNVNVHIYLDNGESINISCNERCVESVRINVSSALQKLLISGYCIERNGVILGAAGTN